MIYCTLFDSNYLDRGLVLLDSLNKVDANAKIYVLCMDYICFQILNVEKKENFIIIPLKDIEDDRLLGIKKQRSRGEYCWTCTAVLIKYVLERYSEKICTYIDADMKFYADPTVLIKEMYENNCCVQTIPHKFAPDKKRREREKSSGRNCVQFNTFTNTEEAKKILNRWIESCLERCSLENGGDQKYTDAWTEYSAVNISKNVGAGIAPWNINRYKLIDQNRRIVKDIYDNLEGTIIFYHFQDLVFPKENVARVIPYLEYWKIDKKLVKIIYEDYLRDLYKKNQYLVEKYNHHCRIETYISKRQTKNITFKYKLNKWFQKPFEMKIDSINYFLRKKIRKKQSEYKFKIED